MPFSSEDGGIKVGKQLRGYTALHYVIAEMTAFFEIISNFHYSNIYISVINTAATTTSAVTTATTTTTITTTDTTTTATTVNNNNNNSDEDFDAD